MKLNSRFYCVERLYRSQRTTRICRALTAFHQHATLVSSYQRVSYHTSYNCILHSYEPEMQPYDEEYFQHALSLVSQQFNMLPPPNYRKNQHFFSPPFNQLQSTKQHSSSLFSTIQIPQKPTISTHNLKTKEAPKEDKLCDTIVGIEEKKNRFLICPKCLRQNHFFRNCKTNVVNDKSFYLRMSSEVKDKERAIEIGFVAQVLKDPHVQSLEDEDDETGNKRM